MALLRIVPSLDKSFKIHRNDMKMLILILDTA